MRSRWLPALTALANVVLAAHLYASGKGEGVLSILVDEGMKTGIPFGLLRTEGGVYAREEVYA
jgi:hypothetical protein